MAKPRVYKTEGIVLKRTPLGEADSIVTIYTPYYGKIRAVAKGVRRPRSKLGGHLEPLTRCLFVLAQGHNLDIITQAQSKETYLALRSNLWRTSCALYLAELVDQFTGEQIENQRVYEELDRVLCWMCEGRSELALRYFELRLLRHLGYQPELHECLECRTKLQPGEHVFSAAEGGVICGECGQSRPSVRRISVDALKVMRFLADGDDVSVRRLRVGPGLADEVETVLRHYINYLLERQVRSTAFLDRLRSQGEGLT